jgi:signal transduction histidine kinase
MSDYDLGFDFRTEIARTGRRMDGSIPGVPLSRRAAARLRRKVHCFTLIAACVVAAASLLATADAAGAPEPQQRSVLIVNQSTALRPWPTEVMAGIQASMRVQPLGSISFHVEHLDLYNFDSPAYRQSLQAHFAEKYRSKPPAVIITIGPGALAVTLGLRDALWPHTPIVFAAVNQRGLVQPLPAGVTGRTFKMTLASMIQAAKAIDPDLKAFAMVGNRFDEQLYYRDFADELPEYAAKYELIDLTGLAVDEVRSRVATLPDDTVIFYLGIHSDRRRVFASGAEALSLVTAVANRPVVVEMETYLGTGAVGGFVLSPDRIGREAGALALRILDGEDVARMPVTAGGMLRPVFDWRALQRWRISEAQLPEGSEIRYRAPAIWPRYQGEIIAVTVLIVLQTALIAGLLYEHRRRRDAEALARSELVELAHMNRLATAGELSASIAHEINQPLAGIVAYAEAGRNWLARPAPDLAEARAHFEQIARAGHRAADVIERIRSFFRKGLSRRELVDVNDLVRDVFLLVGTDLRRRRVTVELALTEPPPSIQGDRVQLQQVILNLAVNAADAMEAVRDRERRLRVTSAREGDGWVRVDVQDSGPGVAADDIDRLFAPFYTTKPHGMGMGLSLSRSLVEAHGGTLKAHRAEPFGMTFSFVLPTPRASGADAPRREQAAPDSIHAA